MTGEDAVSFLFKLDPDQRAIESSLSKVKGTVQDFGRDVGKDLFSAMFTGGGASAKIGRMAGGLIGTLAGGPVGDIIGQATGGMMGTAAEGMAGAGGSAMSLPFKAVSTGLEGIGFALRELQGPLGPIGLGLDTFAIGMKKFGDVMKSLPLLGSFLGPLSDTLAGMPDIIKDVTTSLIGMAAKASPAMFDSWSEALDDVQAVIGRAFVPVLELMRDGVRLFGDVLANVLPDMNEVRGALTEVRMGFDTLRNELKAVMAEVGPGIRQFLIDGLKQLAHWVGVAARALGIMVGQLRMFFGGAGAVGAKAGEARGSAGASSRPAQFSSFEEYEKQFQLAAFSAGGGASIEQQSLDELKALNANLDADAKALVTLLQGGVEAAKDMFQKLVSTAVGIGAIVATTSTTVIGILKAAEYLADYARTIAGPVTKLIEEGKRSKELDEQHNEMKKKHPEFFT